MQLFGKSQKNPTEVIRNLKEAVMGLERGEKKMEKAQEEVSKQLTAVKGILLGSTETEQQTEILVAQLSQELYNSNLLLLLINNLPKIEFEVMVWVELGFIESILLWIVQLKMYYSQRFNTGQEGRGTDFQQHPPTSHWLPLSYGRVHMHKATNPLYPDCWVAAKTTKLFF